MNRTSNKCASSRFNNWYHCTFYHFRLAAPRKPRTETYVLPGNCLGEGWCRGMSSVLSYCRTGV